VALNEDKDSLNVVPINPLITEPLISESIKLLSHKASFKQHFQTSIS